MNQVTVMKLIAQALAISLLSLPASSALADPQSLLMEIYPHGGQTLYCHTSFAPSSQVRIDFIYSKSDLLDHYGCITEDMCAGNADFQRAYNDLHNIYPADLASVLARSGALFGDVPDSVKPDSDQCPFRTSFQTFDPPDYAKGNVARAMVYMSKHYDLPMRGSIITYIKWSQLDPPDQEELDRNKAIKALQGIGNPYVENPALMDKLDDRRTNGLQMNFP
jgi:deoxyribonuclease-1